MLGVRIYFQMKAIVSIKSFIGEIKKKDLDGILERYYTINVKFWETLSRIHGNENHN